MTRRRSRILRLACFHCRRNIADVTGDVTGAVSIRHRARLVSLPDAPSYEWWCRCGVRHRKAHRRLAAAYLEVPAGRVVVRYLGDDL